MTRQRFCIFCGASPLTKEHIWADWLRAYIPKNMPHHHSARSILNSDQSVEQVRKKQPGDPRSRQLKIVCAHCNNGWMSRLQEAAKPILIPLLQGKPSTLNRSRQQIVSAWSAMTVICAEYLQPLSLSIPVTARRWLYQHKMAPNNFRIWIGNYERGDWVPHWVHTSLRISEHEGVQGWTVHPDGTPRPNTQVTTFIAGQLFLHAFTCPFPEILAKPEITNMVDSRLLQIWPIEHAFIAWPTTIITDREADNLAGSIFEAIDAAGRAFGT
jgi:hypothetical protein